MKIIYVDGVVAYFYKGRSEHTLVTLQIKKSHC